MNSSFITSKPGDQVWDLLCVQLVSYLERGRLMWMMPLHLHVDKKSDYDDMIPERTHRFQTYYVVTLITKLWRNLMVTLIANLLSCSKSFLMSIFRSFNFKHKHNLLKFSNMVWISKTHRLNCRMIVCWKSSFTANTQLLAFLHFYRVVFCVLLFCTVGSCWAIWNNNTCLHMVYKMRSMRHSASSVGIFICTPVGRTSDSMMVPT